MSWSDHVYSTAFPQEAKEICQVHFEPRQFLLLHHRKKPIWRQHGLLPRFRVQNFAPSELTLCILDTFGNAQSTVLWTNSIAQGSTTGRMPPTTRRINTMYRPRTRARSATSRRRATVSKHKMAAAEVLGNQLKLYKIRKNNDVIELYLAKKRLTEVPDLSRFKQLKYLWLNHNKIKKINSLTMNYCLKELYLQNNLLTDVTDTLKHLTNLEILMLHNNWLTKLEKVVAELKKLMWLHTLNLFNNPLTQDRDYRLYVIYHLPSVQLLDRKYILQKERDAAFSFCNQDRMRIQRSLAFGQRIHTQLLKQTTPKKNNYTYPGWMTPVPHEKGILKKMKKKD
ncbi:LOW QUALITY PROTEIN: leucine-rich repeat-containing protein 72 [Mobula birostris]|uniref:LOW QUALITY PROTEIN: leucine-rich repeat-containing protein 72 n=1 Tax=Mobula birostris TaxID=1983395 RepID=UPI003B2806A0